MTLVFLGNLLNLIFGGRLCKLEDCNAIDGLRFGWETKLLLSLLFEMARVELSVLVNGDLES